MQATKSHPKSYNILLVEDEGLIARDIAQRVEALGHHVTAIVGTGEEAVESAAGADVALMDIRLDGPMDGIEAAQRIRRRFPIPVVFLTAHADRATLERAKQAEPFGYIVKPVAPAALHTSIEIAVYKHAMEREMAEREAWLRAVLGSVADAVVVADVEGRVRILNPAAEALTGWSEAEAKGQALAKIVPLAADHAEVSLDGQPSNRAPLMRTAQIHTAQMNTTMDGPVPLALLRDAPVSLGRDAQLVTRDGPSIPIEGSAAPVRVGAAGAGEAAIGAVLSFRDVGHRRWEEQQLRLAQKVETAARLAAGVADEYANLLAVIRTHAERLIEQFADYSPARSSAEEIRQAAAAAEQITRKLAGFGKRQPGHPEVLNPNAVLRRLAKLLETVAGAGVGVVIRPGLHAGKIKADEGQFEQLLMNLTTHAGRLCAAGGEIRIETGSAEAAPGSAAGRNPNFVSPAAGRNPNFVSPAAGRNPNFGSNELENPASGFVRIGISYRPGAAASGAHGDSRTAPASLPGPSPVLESVSMPDMVEDESLALSVAHTIVTDHSGFFSAHRAADGTCCWEVLLPRWPEPEAALAAIPPALTHTVLLVEPREIVRAELHKFFEANGYNLLETADAGEAIALAEVREEPFDLVIAPAREAAQIRQSLGDTRPNLALLTIVDQPEQSAYQLRRFFTQASLLERVRLLLAASNTVATPSDDRTQSQSATAR
jgi:CheY-like chemotaxis protein